MLNKQLKNISQSKLSKALNKIVEEARPEATGFITKINKTSLYKTKSFRLRESDLKNFENIVSHVNKNEDRKNYSDSQIIRGIINYFSENIESDFKKIIEYIRVSS
jgi:hypothetical protein